jgi:hypothetical protein
MKVHLWETYNPEKISVEINKNIKDKLAKFIKEDLYHFANKLSINPTRLYEYFIYQTSPIPLNILIKISKFAALNLFEVEQNIVMYKQMFVPIKNSIKEPRLPIEINPYFTSIIANLYFDGSVPKDGKGTYYNQKNEEIMEDFVNKIKCVFGDVQYFIAKDHKGVLKCRVPRIIGEICKKVYAVPSFGTFDSRISKNIFNLSKENKMAFVITSILDEGSIAYDGTIMFGVMNERLCEEVRILCNQVGLITNNLRNKKNSNFYYFHIKSTEKFYFIVKSIARKYPYISLRYKEERLRDVLEIKKKKFYNTKIFADKRKGLILEELKKQNCSINYISSKYLIPPRSIRRYMYGWIKENKVKRIKDGREYNYFLN